MAWFDTKATEDGDGTIDADEQLTAAEWNQHVTDTARNELFGYPAWRLKSSAEAGRVELPGDTTGFYGIQLREPGGTFGAQAQESRAFDDTTVWDPSIPGRITVDVSNITIDDNLNARMQVQLTTAPDTDDLSGNDDLAARVYGNGTVEAVTADDGVPDTTTDTSQNNTYVSGLEVIELAWDGSSLTVRVDDGSTEVVVSEGTPYPNENMYLKIAARDDDGSNARNVDFDVGRITVSN